MIEPRVVTTSWDDGDPNDLRIADLLRSRELAGTFYIPINRDRGSKQLDPSELKALCSEDCEVGAHTVWHKDLSRLGPKELAYEVGDCKQILEQTLGKQILMFCYPMGRYNAAVIRQVRQAGYKGARSTRMLSWTADFPVFEMPTTVQAYPHGRLAYIRNQGRAKSIPGLMRYLTELKRFERWVDLGKQLFDQVLEHGGTWHLYGHSWEIEELGLWDDLREMLDYVSWRSGVTYATNGQLMSITNPSAIAIGA
jgi:hypothetical protein